MKRIYEVRRNRPLFFADPKVPGVQHDGNLWAAPGQFVVIDHPYLDSLIRSQRQKVRELKDGETPPPGSVVHEEMRNPFVRRKMRDMDAILEKKKPAKSASTAARATAKRKTATKSTATPKLSPAPETPSE